MTKSHTKIAVTCGLIAAALTITLLALFDCPDSDYCFSEQHGVAWCFQ